MTELTPGEQYWVDRHPWFLSLGYQLRPRFRPGWVASWVTNPVKDWSAEIGGREDYLRYGANPIMDAVRVSDNKQVMMKRIYAKEYNFNHEHTVMEFVCSPEQIQDHTNHCVPIIETLRAPGDSERVIIVMPLLRKWRSPRFDTIGETLDMMRQAFQGIQYLHRNHIAHRDCTDSNFVIDPSDMYPDGFHAIEQNHNRDFTGPVVHKYTRTQRPPRYYWIDFGLSVPFHSSNPHPRALPVHGGDKSVPEHRQNHSGKSRQLTDPFATDIYYLGSMLRIVFTEGWPNFNYKRKFGFGFLKPLLADMMQEDPEKRPNIDECIARLEEIIQSLSSWTLRSQVWHATDNPIGFIRRFFPHWARRVVYIMTRTPAIPDRSRPPNPSLSLYTNIVLSGWFIALLAILYRC